MKHCGQPRSLWQRLGSDSVLRCLSAMVFSFSLLQFCCGGNDALPSVEVLLIDTVTLTGYGNRSVDETQWGWLTSTLKNSKADFVIVGRHFPVWSICEHGPTAMLVERLKPILEEYNVTAYLAGHDHCAQHIKENSSSVDYHGVGALTCAIHRQSMPRRFQTDL